MWALEAFGIFLLSMSLSACILCLFLNPLSFNFKPIFLTHLLVIAMSVWHYVTYGNLQEIWISAPWHGLFRMSFHFRSKLGKLFLSILPHTWSPMHMVIFSSPFRIFDTTKPIFSYYHISISHCPQLHSTPNPINPLLSSPSPLT